MSVNFRDARGNIVTISDEEATRLTQAGQLRPVGQEILVQAPELGARWVRPDELQEALSKGFRLAPDAQSRAVANRERYSGQAAEAFMDAVARGATFGQSDRALRDAGMAAEEIRGRAEANPTAALLGEMTGGVIPFLPTALAGGVIHGARTALTPFQAAVRTMGREALVGAAEGSVAGLGQAVSDAAMGRNPLTVQKALASAGMGALFGAGFGALGGGIGEVGGRVLGRAARAADDLPTAPGPEPLPGPGPAARVDAPAAELPGGRATTPEAAAPGAPPPPGVPPGAPPGMPPPGAAPGPRAPRGPNEILDDVVEWGLKSSRPIKEAIERNPTFLGRALEALDLRLPTANEAVLRGLDTRLGQMRKLERKGLKERAAAILREDPRFQNVKRLEDAAGLIETKADEAGRGYSLALRALDEVATPAERIDLAAVASRIESEVVDKFRKGPAAFQGMHGMTGMLEHEVARLRRLATEEGPITLTRAEEIKRGFDPLAKFHQNSPPLEMSQAQAYEEVRRIVKQAVEEKADAIAERGLENVTKTWRTAKEQFGAMRELADIAEDRMRARVSNRFFSLTDNMAAMVGAIAGGGLNPVGLGLAVGAAMLNKWGRENLPWTLARALTRMQRPGVEQAADTLTKLVKSLPPSDVNAVEQAFRRPVTAQELAGGVPPAGMLPPGAAPPVLPPGVTPTPGAPLAPAALAAEMAALPAAPLAPEMRQEVGRALIGMLRRAATQGTQELWATHEALSASEEYREELERRGWAGLVLPEDEQEADARGKAAAEALDARQRALDAEGRARAGVLLAIQDRAAKLDRRVAIAAKAALTGGAKPRSRPEVPDAAMKKLVAMAENPEAFQAALAKALGMWPAATPGAATEAAVVMTRAVRHLAPLVPQQGRGPLAAIPALRQPWVPNSLAVATFREALTAAADPASVLDDLAAGRLSGAGLEAVQAIYPELLEEFRAKVVHELTARKDRLSYGQQVQLSLLLGAPLHESLEPATLAALQAVHAPPQPQPRPRPAPVRGPPLAAGLTPAQRLSSKGT